MALPVINIRRLKTICLVFLEISLDQILEINTSKRNFTYIILGPKGKNMNEKRFRYMDQFAFLIFLISEIRFGMFSTA